VLCAQVAKWTFENGMGTIMLQAGELPTPARLAYLQVRVRVVLLLREGVGELVCWFVG
jgi:hypothetical protein